MSYSQQKKPWYDYRFLTHLLLFGFFPVGIYALWKSNTIAKWWKIIVASFVVINIITLVTEGMQSPEGFKGIYKEMLDVTLGMCVLYIFIIMPIQWIISKISNKSTVSNSQEENESKYIPDIVHAPLRGAKFCNISPKDLGESLGRIKITENSHDEYCIGVYNDKDKRVGYLPGGNKDLHGYLQAQYGEASLARVYVQKDHEDGHYYGAVDFPVAMDTTRLRTIEDWDDFENNFRSE